MLLNFFKYNLVMVLISLSLGVAMFSIVQHGDAPKQKKYKSWICISHAHNAAHNSCTTHNKAMTDIVLEWTYQTCLKP
jgi:hypothetical protein